MLGGLKRTGLGRAQSAAAQRRPGGSRSQRSDAGAQRSTRGVGLPAVGSAKAGGKRSAQRSGGPGAGTGAPQAAAVGAGQSVTRPEVERRPTASVQASPTTATIGDRATRRPACRASARALRAPGLHGPGRRERSDRSRRPKRSERARRRGRNAALAKWRRDGDGAGLPGAPQQRGAAHASSARCLAHWPPPAGKVLTGRSASGGGSRASDQTRSGWRETCRLDLCRRCRARENG